jgi:hypothetical protein
MARPLIAVVFLSRLLAQSLTPRFEDYPATGPYRGHNAPLVLTKKDAGSRTRLREAATRKPNFAGHYVLTTWGCGAECVMGAAIDANTGHVHWLPFTICCWKADVTQPIAARLDSRLIVFTGARNEKEGDEGTHYYEFRNGEFIEIKASR